MNLLEECDLQSSVAIGRRWQERRTGEVQFEADERRAVRDLCDVDPCARPGFRWWWKEDVGKDWSVRSRASSPGWPRTRERRDVPQERNALPYWSRCTRPGWHRSRGRGRSGELRMHRRDGSPADDVTTRGG